MRIVVLRDLNLGIAHAILVVYLNGKAWVLDIQIQDVVPAETVRHYRPIYSINERHWWLHRAAPEIGPKRMVSHRPSRRRYAVDSIRRGDK